MAVKVIYLPASPLQKQEIEASENELDHYLSLGYTKFDVSATANRVCIILYHPDLPQAEKVAEEPKPEIVTGSATPPSATASPVPVPMVPPPQTAFPPEPPRPDHVPPTHPGTPAPLHSALPANAQPDLDRADPNPPGQLGKDDKEHGNPHFKGGL